MKLFRIRITCSRENRGKTCRPFLLSKGKEKTSEQKNNKTNNQKNKQQPNTTTNNSSKEKNTDKVNL